jgi:hypothetical protein
MRLGSDGRAARNKSRRMVRADEAPGLRVPPRSEPTTEDLKLVQGYLAREIVRLQERHAEITSLIMRQVA